MKIIIDADACPKNVLQICMEVGDEYSIEVWTVASFNHNIISENHITVGNASQEADLKVANITEKNDIVVTQDWGLAAIILGKGGSCISPAGKVYSNDNIGFMLEERELKARRMRGGGRVKGPKKRGKSSDQKFKSALINLIPKLSDSFVKPFRRI